MDKMELIELKENLVFLHYVAGLVSKDLEKPELGTTLRIIADKIDSLISTRKTNGLNCSCNSD